VGVWGMLGQCWGNDGCAGLVCVGGQGVGVHRHFGRGLLHSVLWKGSGLCFFGFGCGEGGGVHASSAAVAAALHCPKRA
jgi:hypothetical protein